MSENINFIKKDEKEDEYEYIEKIKGEKKIYFAECYVASSYEGNYIKVYEIENLSDEYVKNIIEIEKNIPFMDEYEFKNKILSSVPSSISIEKEFEKFLNVFFDHDMNLFKDKEKKYDYFYKIFTLLRIIPFVKDFDNEYYFDERDESFVLNIYGNGTLKIKVKKKNILDFYYARKSKNGGMISSEGYFKITSRINNSHFSNILLRFAR